VPSGFVFDGLEQLKADLRNLPADLTVEGGHVVEARGNSAAQTIKAGYPDRTGDLRDHLTVTHDQSRFGARSVVSNTSKAAVFFERGSEARHYITKHGVRHETGKMPPNHLFTQTMARERRLMYEQLGDLLTRHGLTVTGTP
jgi:hypothetical protein